jgi:hypothetical protein
MRPRAQDTHKATEGRCTSELTSRRYGYGDAFAPKAAIPAITLEPLGSIQRKLALPPLHATRTFGATSTLSAARQYVTQAYWCAVCCDGHKKG